jgi:tetratricopeptide (TPR) repeat protein
MSEIKPSHNAALDVLRQQIVQDPFECMLWTSYAALLDSSNNNSAQTARAISVAMEKLLQLGRARKIRYRPDSKTPAQLDADEIGLFGNLAELPLRPEDLYVAAMIIQRRLEARAVAEILFLECVRLGYDPEATKKASSLLFKEKIERIPDRESTARDLFRKTGHLTVLPEIAPTHHVFSEATLDRADAETWDDAQVENMCVAEGEADRVQNAAMLAEIFSTRHPQSGRAWDLWTNLGQRCFVGNSLRAALHSYEAAQKIKPELMISWFNTGVALHYLQRLDEALAHYEKAAELDPDQSKVWCNLGALYFEREEYVASEKASRRAVELRPDYLRAWDNLAVALGSIGRWDEASVACEKVLELNPEYLPARLKQAIIWFYDGSYPEAEAAFAMTEADPRFRNISLAYRSICAARLEHFELARELCQKLQNSTADPGLEALAWNELSVVYFNSERYDEAALAAEAAIARQSELSKVWFNLGLARLQLGQHELARKAFAAAVKLDPEDEEAKKLAETTKRPVKKIRIRR